MAESIFTVLSRYKKPEDIMTSGFLYILEYLWGTNRQYGCQVLNKLCDAEFATDEIIEFKMHPHYKKEQGRFQRKGTPDFQIKSPNNLIWVEVKDKSDLRRGQLKEYREKLDEISEANGSRTRLILLRNLFVDTEEAKYAHVRVHWFEVYEWLDKIVKSIQKDDCDSIDGYLVRQFLEFLMEKGVPIMSRLGQVGLDNGFVQLESLLNMAKQAIEKQLECEAIPYFGKVDTSYSIGFHFNKRTYYVEFFLNEPDRIYLTMDKEKLKSTEKRQIDEEKLKKNKRLDQDESYIYARRPLAAVFRASKKGQLQKIAGLLQEMSEDLNSVKKQYRKRK